MTRHRQTQDDRLDSQLLSVLVRSPMLQPLDPGNAQECRVWRACELCSYVEYRAGECPDPGSLSDEAIAA